MTNNIQTWFKYIKKICMQKIFLEKKIEILYRMWVCE